MNSQIDIEMPKEIDVQAIGDIPRNYTVFVRAFEHVVMGGEKPLHHHAMTQEEYERFVNDMWIGIVLTLVVVFIVFALCFWYMYHKFQQWKRHYDARSRLRANGNGMSSADLETLPNYSLVSGLPTYDDALEQLRLSSTTNHRLIKHQTIMKFFDSVNEKIDRTETPLPSYEDAIVKSPPSGDWPPNVFDSKNVSYSVLPSVHGTSHTQLPFKSLQLQLAERQNRFKCILVPESRNLSLEAASCSNESQSSLPLRSSLGSLNIINEIRNSKPDVPWVHGSALSLCLDYDTMPKEPERYEHRASLH